MALTDEEEVALRDQLAAAQTQSQEAAAAARKAQLTALLKDINAPVAFADVVPADMDLTADALKGYVAQFAPPAPTATATDGGAPNLSAWAAYERGQETGVTPGAGGENEVELLLKEGMDGLEKLIGQGRDWNHHKPPEEMREDNEAYAAKANKVNRRWESQIRRGQGEASGVYSGPMGFGGRVDPPRYAYRALDGQTD